MMEYVAIACKQQPLLEVIYKYLQLLFNISQSHETLLQQQTTKSQFQYQLDHGFLSSWICFSFRSIFLIYEYLLLHTVINTTPLSFSFFIHSCLHVCSLPVQVVSLKDTCTIDIELHAVHCSIVYNNKHMIKKNFLWPIF